MEYMIEIIRNHWFYDAGSLEAKSEEEIREIFEQLLDWINE